MNGKAFIEVYAQKERRRGKKKKHVNGTTRERPEFTLNIHNDDNLFHNDWLTIGWGCTVCDVLLDYFCHLI